jgi:putative serine protease PepD
VPVVEAAKPVSAPLAGLNRWLSIVLVTTLTGGLAAACSSSGKSSEDARACDATSVAGKALPSVVTIHASNGSAASTGSGEIIRSDGYILTNSHVVSVAADGGSIEIVFSDGASAPASIKGRDPLTDLAVLHIEPQSPLPVIAMGSSNTVQIGQPVVALGAPLGLSSTVTSGIVSALDRTVQVEGENGKNAVIVSAIQTDAAINPGNSGGALTNCAAELIGVPTATASVPTASGEASAGSIGVGFAIPVDVAKLVSDELIASGSVSHAYVGIEVMGIPPTAAENGKPEGIYVVSVVPNGPAAAAGLQAGDIITKVDGKPATDPNELAMLLLQKKPGETISVTYTRDGKSTDTTITLGSQP